MDRFRSLDGARGLCALCVVVYHIHAVGALSESSFFRGSAVFVEMFFVLSGFVITHSLSSNNNYGLFIIRRIKRLYPLHLAMLLAVISFQLIKLAAADYVNFSAPAFSGKTDLLELMPNLLLLQSWIPTADYLSFNAPSWSISVEVVLYALIFPISKFFKDRDHLAFLATSLAAFYMLIFDVGFITEQGLRGLSCFFAGAFVYRMPRISRDIAASTELPIVIAILLLVGIEFNNKGAVLSVLFCLAVYVLSFDSGVISKLLKAKPIQFLGGISYSVYMTHIVVFMFAGAGFKLLGLNRRVGNIIYIDAGSELVNNVLVILLVALGLLASSLSYKYIEKR